MRKITIQGSASDLRTWIYKDADTGLVLRETVIDSGKNDGNIVEIIQASDFHINYCNGEDLQDEELAYTVQCRKWNANARSLVAIDKVMDYASSFEQLIITGDTLDYLSKGAIELMHQHIWDRLPQTLIALGGHDQLKQMQTKMKDKTPVEERRAFLQQYWKHDILYVSKVLKNKVMVIVLDNGSHRYVQEQADKLQRDISLARREGYVVLIFQHEPISTGNPNDANKECIRKYQWEQADFYNVRIGNDVRDDKITRTVYKMITENGDIIKGLFCGHVHSTFYTEVLASYVDSDNTRHNCVIPQTILVPSVYDDCAGHVMKITVK